MLSSHVSARVEGTGLVLGPFAQTSPDPDGKRDRKVLGICITLTQWVCSETVFRQ